MPGSSEAKKPAEHPARTPSDLPEGFVRNYMERAKAALAEDFKGITTGSSAPITTSARNTCLFT